MPDTILTWDDTRTFEALGDYTYEGVVPRLPAASIVLSPLLAAFESMSAIPAGSVSWR